MKRRNWPQFKRELKMDGITVIIALLIIGIVADGFRRVRKSRRENLLLSKRVQELDGEDSVRVSSSEFPSGGARIAARREADEAVNLNQDVRKSFESSRITVGAPKRTPEQRKLNLEEVVPMLMDSLESEESQEDLEFDNDGPSFGDMQEIDGPQTDESQIDEPQVDASREQAGSAPPIQNSKESKSKDVKSDAQKEMTRDKDSTEKQSTEVLIVSVMAKSGERLLGTDLLQALMELRMKFGEMDIFHRHEDENADGHVYFSLANIVVPGTFNLAEIKDFSTPGVSLFMQLPLHPDCESLEAFDIFASTARSLATRLSGELKDENRSVMTSQTFEHYRQRVIEFERRKKLQHS